MARFHAEANMRELPGLGIGSWACSNLRIARPRELLDGNDNLILTIITSGNTRASRRGRDIELSPGQAVLQSSAEAANMVFHCRQAASLASGCLARRSHRLFAIPKTC